MAKKKNGLTRAHKHTLDACGVPRGAVTPAIAAGADPDAVVALARARANAASGTAYLPDDLSGALTDTGLVVTLVGEVYSTAEIRDALTANQLTADDVFTAESLRIVPDAVTSWAAAGRPLPDLADLEQLPDLTVSTHVCARLAGVPTTDLTWLRDRASVSDEVTVHAAMLELLRNPDATERSRTGSDRQRRLMLLYVTRGFPAHAGSALLSAVGDTDWLDTLTTFILDGTPIDQAIELARADHALEQQRTVTVAKAAVPTGTVPTPER